MSDRFLRAAAAGWYGPLLNPGPPQASLWMPDGGFGDADAVVAAQAVKWRRINRAERRAFRTDGFSREKFYGALEEYCPAEEVLETRRALQNAHLLALTDAERDRLHVLSVTVEHAVLTQNAVLACNALAKGEVSATWAVPQMRILATFRQRFRDSLGYGFDQLSRQEMLSGDATGQALVNVLAGAPVVVAFDGPVFHTTYTNEAAGGARFPGSPDEIGEWSQMARQPLPKKEVSSETGEDNVYDALVGFAPGKIPDDGDIELVIWGAGRSCTVAVNGTVLGRVSVVGGASETTAFPVERKLLASGPDIVLAIRSRSGHESIPIRGAFLIHRLPR